MSSTTPRAGRRRLVPLLGTFLVGAALALGSAAPASAAPNIDPNAVGSITVHKFQEPNTPTGKLNNGTQVDTTGLTPISGVTFSVSKVNVDLTSSAAWQNLSTYSVATAQANLTGTPTTGVTNGSGVASFPALPVGLYLVTESNVGTNNIVVKGQPFLVTIPLAVNNDWLYDVHVYPKNTVTQVTKTVDDSAARVIGDGIAFTLTGQSPSLPAATPLTAFGFTDTLDSRLTYVSTAVTVPGITVNPATDYTATMTGQNYKLDFTPAGLAKLRTVQGAAVTVKINTTISSLGSGTITNTAAVYVNDPANPVASNTVTSSWGALKLTKVQAGNTAVTLTGAEFEIYELSTAGTRVGPAIRDVSDGDSKFVTGADGTFTVNGLKATNYEIVETKAPLGYRLDSTVHKVTVTAGNVTAAVPVQITNAQIPAFLLPLTGSTGVALFTGIGVLLVAAGIALALVRKRRTARS